MAYERGEADFVVGWKVDTHVLEVTAIYNLFDHEDGYIRPYAGPGYYGTAAKLG